MSSGEGGAGSWQHCFKKESTAYFTEDIAIIDVVTKIHIREKNSSSCVCH